MPYRLAWLITTAVYLGHTAFIHFRTGPPFINPIRAQLFMQVMDIEWLKNHFWECLIYNHYQPPLTSTILIGSLLQINPNWVVPGYFLLNVVISFASLMCFMHVLKVLQCRPLWIMSTGLVMGLYSFRVESEFTLLYTIPAMFQVTLLTFLFVQFIRKPSLLNYILYGLPVIGLTLTLSYFHFSWGIISLIVPVLMVHSFKKYLPIFILLTALTLIVPAKNWVIFGNFGSSSCLGMVLACKIKNPTEYLRRHINNGIVDEEARAALTPFHPKIYLSPKYSVPDKFKNIKCLSRPWKNVIESKTDIFSSGFNYNYYAVLPMNKILAHYAVEYIMANPGEVAMQLGRQFVQFFSGFGTMNDPVIPPYFSDPKYLNNGFSLRGLFYVGGLLTAAWYLLWCRKNATREDYKIILFILFQAFYGMFIGIVVTIYDGPRYRMPFEYLFLTLSAFALNIFIPTRIKTHIFKPLEQQKQKDYQE